MELADYAAHDALGLGELVAKGEVSPRELALSAREAIAALNPALNAVVEVYDDRMLCAYEWTNLSFRRAVAIRRANGKPCS